MGLCSIEAANQGELREPVLGGVEQSFLRADRALKSNGSSLIEVLED